MTHALYVTAAYGISGLVLAGLIVWLVADRRVQRQALAELEAAGTRRRSERNP